MTLYIYISQNDLQPEKNWVKSERQTVWKKELHFWPFSNIPRVYEYFPSHHWLYPESGVTTKIYILQDRICISFKGILALLMKMLTTTTLILMFSVTVVTNTNHGIFKMWDKVFYLFDTFELISTHNQWWHSQKWYVSYLLRLIAIGCLGITRIGNPNWVSPSRHTRCIYSLCSSI